LFSCNKLSTQEASLSQACPSGHMLIYESLGPETATEDVEVVLVVVVVVVVVFFLLFLLLLPDMIDTVLLQGTGAMRVCEYVSTARLV